MKLLSASILFGFILMISCQNNDIKYIKQKAYVSKSSYVHIGNGYFKLKIDVVYNLNGIDYKNAIKANGTYLIASNKVISVGDSVLIKINEKKPHKIKYIKKVYPKNDINNFRSITIEVK